MGFLLREYEPANSKLETFSILLDDFACVESGGGWKAGEEAGKVDLGVIAESDFHVRW